jgi:hypothetical protein
MFNCFDMHFFGFVQVTYYFQARDFPSTSTIDVTSLGICKENIVFGISFG